MRILIISDAWHPQINGVVRTYENLIHELTVMGHETHILGPRDFPFRWPMPGYSEIELVAGPYGRLRQAIERHRPEHLHIATEGPLGWAAWRYCRKHGLPFTTCYHTQFADYAARRMRKVCPPLENWAHQFVSGLMRRFHGASQAVMVATPSLETQLRERGFTNPILKLTRGIDHSVFHPGKKNLFTDLPRPIALYVGRVAVEKSIEDFLDMAWSGSKVVVGIGPSLKALQEQYPQVVFTGQKTGVALADHYRSADVFVFPSRTDTFGLVLIEAMACGLPIAGYPVTGPIDIVSRPFLGAIDEDLSSAAHKAFPLPGADQRAQYARDHYSWRRAAEQFLKAV